MGKYDLKEATIGILPSYLFGVWKEGGREMVLWELTLATAYVLGLKRSYRLALRLQRRLISSRHAALRQFVHRRTRNIFDIALRVHRNIQNRDIEMGRSIGSRILRWLDRIKPSANIRGSPSSKLTAHETRSSTKAIGARPCTGVSSVDNKKASANRQADRNLFVISTPVCMTDTGCFASLSKDRYNESLGLSSRVGIRALPLTTLSMWWQPVRQNIIAIGPCRNVSFSAPVTPELHLKYISRGVIREDIAVWMQQYKNNGMW